MASLINTATLDKRAEEKRQMEKSAEESRKEIMMGYLKQLETHRNKLIDILDTTAELRKRGLSYSTKIEGLEVEIYSCKDAFIVRGGTGGANYHPLTNEIKVWSGDHGVFDDATFSRSMMQDSQITRILTCKCYGSKDTTYHNLLLKLIEQIGAYAEGMERQLVSRYGDNK